ncbi:MAG TPA: LemA family protein [Porphyromonadaceae bacterium]|jgi:LemA protein|nr:LemA family protein [Muribaculaceae bacterium Isolate-013 (NCI)]HAP29293.1 LemA family protein [Porphyromonadaceae bacterium]
MKKSLIVTIAVACILALCFIGGCSSYNGMVSAQQSVDKQWGNVENAYQRRADLIPNLVNTVKGYAEHEKSTLQNVTDARAGLTQAYNDATASQADASPENVAAYQQAQEKLNSALNVYVNAVREAYPDLKANENFLGLQAELEQTENRVATERKRYNDEVEKYNVKVLRFPGNIFASMFGFQKRDMFKAEAGAERAPKVEF